MDNLKGRAEYRLSVRRKLSDDVEKDCSIISEQIQEIDRLTAELAECEAKNRYTGTVISEILSMTSGDYTGNIRKDIETIVKDQVKLNIDDQLTAAREENERLREKYTIAMARLEDMYEGDDGQAWTEAKRVLDEYEAALAAREVTDE